MRANGIGYEEDAPIISIAFEGLPQSGEWAEMPGPMVKATVQLALLMI